MWTGSGSRIAVCLLAALWASGPLRPAWAQDSAPPRVVPFLVLPADSAYDGRRLPLDITAVRDVQAWYRHALGGVTFVADPVIVRRSRHTFAALADSNFQAWWPLLQAEFADLGYPWKDRSDIKVLLLVHGAGAWAGSDSENGGLRTRAEAGTVPAGNFGGFVVIGDSSVGGLLTGACPTAGIQRGTAWWCNWNTYRGTIAHELGHTFGLPHPDALRPHPDTAPRRWDCAVEGNTVLQCHWGFPYDSLLPYDRAHLRSLRYFRDAQRGDAVAALADRMPRAVVGDVRIRRPGTARAADAGDGLLWVDDATGQGATGYAWAVGLPGGASITWPIGDGCRLLAFAAGRERGAGGTGTLAVLVNDSTVWRAPLPSGAPRAVQARVCGRGSLAVRAEGDPRFRAVVGNPRFYVPDR